MPITRSTGRGRQQTPVQESSSATEESGQSGTTLTTETDGTTETEATTATGTTQTTGTGTTATGATATTTTTEASKRTQTSLPGTEATVRQIAPSTVTQQPPATSQDAMPKPADQEKKNRKKRTPSVKSVKAYKLAKAREELARLQVELASARIAVLEAESDEEDDASMYSQSEHNQRVQDWLQHQEEQQQQQPAILAITQEPHTRPEVTDERRYEEPVALQQKPPVVIQNTEQQQTRDEREHRETIYAHQPQQDLGHLVDAITQLAKSTRPRFMELPVFNGSHQDWLYFRASYQETEKMHTKLENLNRLRRNLKGRAREAVEAQLITNSEPAKIMEILEARFGRPDAIASAEMETLRALPRLTESPRDICIYSTKVSNVVATLQALDCVYYLYNPEVGKSMVEKMASTLRFKYYEFASTLPKETPELIKLAQFLKREADICGPYAQPEQVITQQQSNLQKRVQKVHTVTEKNTLTEKNTAKCPVCDETGHAITECETFKKQNNNERWDTAKSHRLCFRCLRLRTKMHSCRQRTCGIDGCKYFHNRLLHFKKEAPTKQEDDSAPKTEAINSAWTAPKKQSYLKIIPVTASGPDGEVDTYALLDDGSTVTLIDDNIADKIGATGPIEPLRIEAINSLKTGESKSRRVRVTLKGVNNRQESIQARTVQNLNVTTQKVPRNQVEEYKHLRDITHLVTYSHAKPGILIGQDNCHLLLSTKVKKGRKNQPVASLTPLGWVLHGSQHYTSINNVNFVNHLREEPSDENLEDLMKQYFAMDSLGITPKKPKTDPEERALRILEKHTVHKENGRYETALLWKTEEVNLPDNYGNSLKRLYSIEKKLDRDPSLKQKYTEQMEDLVLKGYAEPAPKEKTENKTWYLPHFGVVNAMKPEKLRVVHDAAAKTKGVSLNDMLLKGPDLLQSLPGVVMRFRQHEIAVTADIKEMFMQVKLRTEDRDALRYLWRGNRRDDQPPEEYRMTSLIFGASSSPATAIYVKNVNAKKHEATHPEASRAIIEKHYVDDYLDSFKSLEDAKQITTEVREIQKKAGYELKQWKSNSPQLLQAIGEIENTESTELYKSEDKTERVLGLIWRPEKDEFTFNLNMTRIPTELIDGKTPTKREALRIVMSLFDPLGFASPVTIRAKQILQEVWRRGTAWDTEIDEDLATSWKEWLVQLKGLSEVTIPRCYQGYSEAQSLQLHIFTDASESAYAATLFWRTVSATGEINVSHIIAKAKVAPLKLTSIPRLELQAAVLGVRLAETVIREHERKPDSKTFWTDSRTALSWIKTGPRSYKPYVAHRLAEIEDSSTVNEWRWIPTKLNVADDATRDVPRSFNKDHRWYKGPEFLYEDESSWPIDESSTASTEPTGEERVHHVTASKNEPKLTEALPDVSRFSNWERLRYTTARVLQFIQLCKTKTETVHYKRTTKSKQKDQDWKNNPNRTKKIQHREQRNAKEEKNYLPVGAELLIEAEALLMRASQEESFAQEIECIKSQRSVNKDSRLHQLSTEYVDGVLRLRSRIEAAQQVSDRIKRPMVLDGNHPTVRLWIQNVHRRLHHAGVEATINECRQQYWVLRVRPVTRTIIRRCLHCRMRTQTPPYPRTGDLPSCRLAHHQRPFTFTGVDYFGPLTVTVGRANQKRYVAIYTCLTTRAIHLEIAGSLSSSSAIMTLRRMMARRGCPKEIWSDNGTNLKAADKELRQEIDRSTAGEAAKRSISWRFIPPGAPFMGGAWERMVRSVKTALAATLHERYPTEEVLTTLLTEVEYTVNSRPLTHVSVNPEDPEALTPNHFLLGGPGTVPTTGTFTEKDLISRSSWRASQKLADDYWDRWLREYLPELQHRREPHGKGRTLRIGDLVYIADSNLPRNTWPRGRVIATFPGPDGIVRTADIQTKGGVLRRPVRRLIILPVEDSETPAPVPSATSHGGRNVQDAQDIDS